MLSTVGTRVAIYPKREALPILDVRVYNPTIMRFFKERAETANLPAFEGVILRCPSEGSDYDKQHYLNSLKIHLEMTIRGECKAEKWITDPWDTLTDCTFVFYPTDVLEPLTPEDEVSAVAVDELSANGLWFELTKTYFPGEYRAQAEIVYAGAI